MLWFLVILFWTVLCGRSMLQSLFNITVIGKRLVQSLFCWSIAKSRKKVSIVYWIFRVSLINYLFTNIIFSIICLFKYDSCVFSIIINSGRYPLSVSNTYSFTKLFINDDMPEINMFRERLVTLNQSCVFLLYSVYNRCRNWLAYGYIPIFNSLPKDDQTMS